MDSLLGGKITLQFRLVTKNNHNVMLGEETVETNVDGKIPIKKLEQKWNLQPNTIFWVDGDTKIKSDKNGWSDVSFAFMEGDRPILVTGDAAGSHVGFNTPATKETVNALNTKVNQYNSASASTTTTSATVKPTTSTTPKSALSGLVKASQNKEATTTTNQPTSTGSSALDDLEKLADLRAKGILTEEEFQMKKKQILGL